MKKSLIIILAILAVIILIGSWFWGSYNKLVVANEQVGGQWAQVEVQYQRRFDLMPNLVESVKGAMGQEQKVFGDLAAARASYSGAATVNAKAEAASQVEGALGRLLVIMENYPQLRSVEVVQNLMVQLEGTENRVSVERNRFNEIVKGYNVLIKRVPMNIMASIFNYSEKAYFLASPEAATAPKVNLDLNN
jgi:LemA protein